MFIPTSSPAPKLAKNFQNFQKSFKKISKSAKISPFLTILVQMEQKTDFLVHGQK